MRMVQEEGGRARVEEERERRRNKERGRDSLLSAIKQRACHQGILCTSIYDVGVGGWG